ncbi:hypothetical protein PYCC9005_003674 [Savitreella phatthalungensis]
MFLGLDLSTQQLKGVIIDDALQIQYTAVVAFDVDLPSYKTKSGVYVMDKQVLSPVAMWMEAVDLLCTRLRDAGVDMSSIRAISGSGQQHGTIYWNSTASSTLASLDPSLSLADNLRGCLAYDRSPNWQDASTQEECEAFEHAVGGPHQLAKITGSKAHHRFSGPQIARLRKTKPDVYANTDAISLVSSFLCSLWLGKLAPVDPADICGMNLWDVEAENWHGGLLAVCGGGEDGVDKLARKLPKVCMNASERLGGVSPYFVEKYGFSRDCAIFSFTGDNPATILSLPLLERDAIISLGTSTTLLLSTRHYKPSPDYHLFAHPTTKGLHMAMLCYKNGSLAREYVRDAINAAEPDDTSALDISDSDNPAWAKFNALALTPRPTGWPQKAAFFYPLDEIIPPAPKGTYRFLFPSPSATPIFLRRDEDHAHPPTSVHAHNPQTQKLLSQQATLAHLNATNWRIPQDDPRLILESSLLDIRARAAPFFASNDVKENQVPAQPRTIYCVGGASSNRAVVGMVGCVLGGETGVWRQKGGVSANACALGGACKAAWAYVQPQIDFDQFVRLRWHPESAVDKLHSGYQQDLYQAYTQLITPLTAAQAQIVTGNYNVYQAADAAASS